MQATLQADPQPPTAREATPLEAEDYAAREEQAPKALAEFEGGDTTVILGSTTVVILLIILIIVLI